MTELPRPAASLPARSAASRVWLWTPLAAATLSGFILLANADALRFSPDRRRIVVATLASALAPYVIGLLATLAPMTRRFGLTVLACTAVVGVAVAAWFGFATFAYFGLFAAPFALVLVPLGAANVALALAAIRAGFEIEPSRFRVTGVAVGLVAITVHVVLSLDRLDRMERGMERARAASIADAARPDQIVETLRRCLASSPPAARLGSAVRRPADLGPEGRRCLTQVELQPPDRGYAVHVFAPTAVTQPRTFTVCVTREQSGRLAADVVDERGRHAGRRGRGATPAAACADAYDADRLRQTRLCLQAWAAAHGGGYPERLTALKGPAACLPTKATAGTSRLTYTPGASRGDGTVERFVAVDVLAHPGEGGAKVRRLDDSGDIHVTTASRLASVHDPRDGSDVDEALPSVLWGLDVAALERACSLGRPRSCVLLARALERRSLDWRVVTVRRNGPDTPAAPVGLATGGPVSLTDAARALSLYRAGCQAWDGEGCAAAARMLRAQATPAGAAESRQLDIRGCSRGVEGSCAALESSGGRVAHGRIDPRDPRSLREQCAGDVGAACTLEADRLGDTAPASEVLPLYERGCEYGDPEACLRMAAVLPDAQRATAIRAIACAVVPDDARCGYPRP